MNPEDSTREHGGGDRLDSALAAYHEAEARGEAPGLDTFLALRSDLADGLRAYFGVGRRLAELVGAPRGDGLDDFEVLGELGRGGMGVVFEARQRSLGRPVALKMILGLAGGEEARLLRREAEAAALDHPGIVPIYLVGEHDGLPFFAMKLIRGASLRDHLGRLRADPRAASATLAAVARAIHHAHRRGVLHLDLKPGNVLIDEDGRPVVTDFGLAKSAGSETGLTALGSPVGTAEYMSPEQGRRPS